jgi:PAS domain S-box-containing protein
MDELTVFRKAVDALPFGVTLWEADSDDVVGLRLVYANPQASREADIDLARLLGRPLRELLPGGQLAEKGKSLGLKGLQAALQKVAHDIPRYELAVRGQPRQFRIHMVPVWDRTVAMVYERLRDGSDEHDIPTHTRIFFEEIVETFHEPLVVVDGETRIAWANGVFALLLGLDVADLVGRTLTELPGEAFAAEPLASLVGQVLDTGSTVQDAEISLNVGNAKRTLLVNARRLHGTDHHDRPVLLALRDVTAERSAQALQRSYVHKLLEVRDEERKRVARELHDEVGQSVELMATRLRRLRDAANARENQDAVAELLEDVGTLAADVGRLAAGLHPFVLDELGFEAAVRQQLREFGQAHGLRVDVAMTGLEDAELDPTVALALYRMIQEGLTNVARHAEATSVNVVVRREAGQARVVVEDDGIGFDPEAPAAEPRATTPPRLGLLGLRERAALLGGHVEIESGSERGTTLVIAIPVT